MSRIKRLDWCYPCCVPRCVRINISFAEENIAAASIMDSARYAADVLRSTLQGTAVMKVIFLWLPWSVGLSRQYVAPGYRTGQVNKTLAVRRSQRPLERSCGSHMERRSRIFQRRGEELAGSPGNYSNWNCIFSGVALGSTGMKFGTYRALTLGGTL